MSPRRLLLFVIVATALLLAYNHSFTNEMLITTHQVLAQVPPIPTPPSLPGAGEETLAGNQLPNTDNSQSQLPQSAAPTNIPPPTIQITSHQDGSQVPVGELTIQGTSSDNQESNCQVYADVNDITPLQNATAAGANGADDYSQWTFTYAENYQLITQGVNELTAKISCFDNGGSGGSNIPLSEWHSVNVTGVVGGATITTTTTPTPTMTQAPTANALEAEQRATNIPPPFTSPAVPSTTAEDASAASSQGLGEGAEQGGDGDDDGEDDDEDGDDEGDDGDDDDDGGEGDDG
jgi:hypothetical protein